MKAVRTLFFVLPDDATEISGGNLYNRYFIRALQQKNVPVEKIPFSAYEQAILENIPGIYWVDSLLMFQAQSLLNKEAEDVISCFILHHLGSLFPENGESSQKVFAKQEKAILKWFSIFLVTSDFSKQYLLKNQIDKPIIVIPPAVSLPVSSAQPSKNKIQALIVSNLIERKGIREFLEYLSTHTSEIPNQFQLDIVGRTDMDAEYTAACKKIIADNQVLQQHIRLTGPVPHEEIPAFYLNANLVISPSAMETFGMTLQEAVAYGIPVLACEGGFAQHHVRNGKTGQLFSSTADLTSYLVQLVNNPEKLEEMMRSAQQTVGELIQYTWDDAAQLFITKLKLLGII